MDLEDEANRAFLFYDFSVLYICFPQLRSPMNNLFQTILLLLLLLPSVAAAQSFTVSMGEADRTFYLDSIPFRGTSGGSINYVNNTGRTVIVTQINIFNYSGGESFTITDSATFKKWLVCSPGQSFAGPQFTWTPKDSANETSTLAIGVTYHNASTDSTYGATGCHVVATEFNPNGKGCIWGNLGPWWGSIPIILGGWRTTSAYVNNGNPKWPSIVQSVDFSGADAASFTLDNFPLPAMIGDGTNIKIPVRFTPLGPPTQTDYSATMSIHAANDSCGPLKFDLNAKASGDTPTDSTFDLSIAPDLYIISPTKQCTREYVFKNRTTSAMTITFAEIVQEFFKLGKVTLPRTLAPDDTIHFSVTYTADSANIPHNATLTIDAATQIVGLLYAIWTPQGDVVTRHEFSNDLEVYPNPASSSLTIESSHSTGSVQILDLLGNAVAQFENASFPLEWHLPSTTPQSAIYLVRVVSGRSTETRRIVVER